MIPICTCFAMLGILSLCTETANAQPASRLQPTPSDEIQLDLSVGTISSFTRSNWWRTTRDYNTKYHPWTPPGSLEAWKAEATRLRTQILVSQGLWPLPKKTPLKPVVHGKIDCGDYTIEKVFFASRPGLYVSGNLYRPVGFTGKRPGILSPHGHWKDGRFYDAGETEAAKQIASGAESNAVTARSPLQARMVQLARMGSVVFHYDMIGNADSQGLDHRTAFTTAQDGLWLLESMGQQTWNSIRALDFITSLDDVDPQRIAVTGASGGGTQTFVLCAIDDRPAVAVPAVMVSTGMQGGCACENAPYLRLNTNNIAFASLFAPKPLGLTGANDWTVQLETRGLPELQRIYRYYSKSDNLEAWVHPEFGHNYNAVSRKHMYGFLKKHLHLENASIEERPFDSKTPQELTVYNESHPRPTDTANPTALRGDWIAESNSTIEKLLQPENKKQYQKIVGSASRVLLGGEIPTVQDLSISAAQPVDQPVGATLQQLFIARKDDATVVPVSVLAPSKSSGDVLCWFDPQGSACIQDMSPERAAMVADLLKNGTTIVVADIRGFGANRPSENNNIPPVNARYYGYTFGYNLPLISEQVKDVSAVLVGMQSRLEGSRFRLLGTSQAGPCVLLAQSMCSDIVEETEADLNGIGLTAVDDIQSDLYLPGASKYGGFAGLAGVTPCQKFTLHGVNEQLQKELAPLKEHVKSLELKPTNWKP
ncbi:MAG: acetylxylan esterase [Planctomycetaceae bacterium]|nr:acetylxylan esterase [Planctomycetaceae bacterium]